jgi:hypothetical protein
LFGFFKISIFASAKMLILMYYERFIDRHLEEWVSREVHKPVLLRGARQVGKSTAVRHLGEKFDNYVEINFERQPEYKAVFSENLVVERIVSQISVIAGKPIVAGKTLLFLDEVQACPEAIMSLRFFKEDMPELHVVAAGSLLEFALQELPTFGVGRIHSMFITPMSFDEFLLANGCKSLLEARNRATAETPLSETIHKTLINHFRSYMLVGGMPEVVAKWVATHDYLQCQEVQDDIVVSYEDDFPKYRKRVDPVLLRQNKHSAAVQLASKFSYSKVGGGYRTDEVKKALEMLVLAGILVPVVKTDANGLPLASESDDTYKKILLLDSGLTMRILNMTLGDVTSLTTHILTADAVELINKGPLAEMIAGLEMMHYDSPNMRHSLYYWMRMARNSQAEIDYVAAYRGKVLPIEVKAGGCGKMKSLWMFMRDKNLGNAVRCSLENFSKIEYIDKEADDSVRHVVVCPLYAMSMIPTLLG